MFEGTKVGIIVETEWHDCYTFFRICYNNAQNLPQNAEIDTSLNKNDTEEQITIPFFP